MCNSYCFWFQEKVDHLRAESEAMRRREREFLSSHQTDTEQRVQRAVSQFQQLPQEIESLRAVLEMRNQEIHDLRRKNLEIEKQVRCNCVMATCTNISQF